MHIVAYKPQAYCTWSSIQSELEHTGISNVKIIFVILVVSTPKYL